MRIVSLAHYPVSAPRHGGQHRVSAIHQELRAAGHEVHFIPVFLRNFYPDATEDEGASAAPKDLYPRMQAAGWREDLHLVRELGLGSDVARGVIARLEALAPQVILLEQPWLFDLAEAALKTVPALKDTALVYSSQNVEAGLMDPAWQAEALDLEQRLVRRAELVVAVSAEDAGVFDRWRGAGQAPSVVAPNGCWAPDPLGAPPAAPIAGEFALVTGSAHPPNAAGYWECIGTIPGFLAPGQRLAVVGGMNGLLQADPRFSRFRSLNDEMIHHAGVVEASVLNAFLHHAKAFVLPVTSGGGTNLKTAEALIWCKPVVAMRPALRGYEEAESFDGVYVAQTPVEFRHLLRQVMAGELGSERRPEDVARYAWPAQLRSMVEALETLV